MFLLLQILFAPHKAAVLIKAKPRWLAVFLFLSALSTICYALIHPHLVQATLDHLPLTASGADKYVVADTLQRELPVKLAFFPIRLFIGWSTFSLLLLYVCRAFNPLEPVRFRQALSLDVYSESIPVIGTIAGSLLTLQTVDLALPDVPWTLGIFFGHGQSFIVKSLLNSLNIFTLWQMIVLSIGVSFLCNFRRFKSFCIVLIVWLLSTMFNLATLKLMQDELHLLL